MCEHSARLFRFLGLDGDFDDLHGAAAALGIIAIEEGKPLAVKARAVDLRAEGREVVQHAADLQALLVYGAAVGELRHDVRAHSAGVADAQGHGQGDERACNQDHPSEPGNRRKPWLHD